jgi:YjbE family integral membrane protein
LAAALLVMFTLVVTALLQLPGLRLVAGCALIFIAIKLLGPRVRHTGAVAVQPAQGLWRAVWLIVAADVVMSLDNAVAVASVANGRYVLLGLGLAISIPTVVAGSAIVLRLMRRFPIIVWAGAAILGWVAGELAANDPIVAPHASALAPGAGPLETWTGLNVVEVTLALLGVAVVLLTGVVRRRGGTRGA